ncbi:MAG: DUF2530 domain-containing protein [Nocardioidaceae bacterium]
MTNEPRERLRGPAPLDVPAQPDHVETDHVETDHAQPGHAQAGQQSTHPTTQPTAPVAPLDVTGVRTIGVGTVLWLLAFLVLLPFHEALADHGRTWWLWTCLAGFGLGVIGVLFCRRRRRRLAARPAQDVETSPLGAAGL